MPLHMAGNYCYADRVAAENVEETPNDDSITESNRLEAIEAMVTAMYDEWQRLRPLVDRLLDNPAVRWKARRNASP